MAPVTEFIERNNPIAIRVHELVREKETDSEKGQSVVITTDSKEIGDALSSSIERGDCGDGGVAQQGVDAGHDDAQFLLTDVSAVLHVVQIEDPAQLLRRRSTRQTGQHRHELLLAAIHRRQSSGKRKQIR